MRSVAVEVGVKMAAVALGLSLAAHLLALLALGVRKLEGAGQPSEAELQVGIDHVYHHLNFAWNARRMGNKRAFGCSDADFNRWSRFPRDINFSRVEGTQGRGANSRRLAHSWMRG